MSGTNVSDSEVELRGLSNVQFLDRYGCDRFTASVLANRFRYTVQHMVSQIQTTAFSPILRSANDFAVSLHGPESLGFAMVAVSQSLPVFIGAMPEAVRISLEEYGVENLKPDDVVVVNDYYRVGTHLNDACFIRPVFHQGELVGVVTVRAHQLDIGGRTVGGFDATKTSTYEDGLVLAPMLLYDGGKPVRSVFSLLNDNSRFGPLILPDVKTFSSALRLGDQLLCESVEKYGTDGYLGAVRYACDVSAETMRRALTALPDGVYEGEDYVDCDWLTDQDYRVHLKLTKKGGRAEIDLSGSSQAAPSAMNCAWPDVKTAVAVALKLLLDRETPFTTGSLRDVDIVVPPDAFFNPSPPHACHYYFQPMSVIIFAAIRALGQALGASAIGADSQLITATARNDGPVPTWSTGQAGLYEQTAAWAATQGHDGPSGQSPLLFNLFDAGLEPGESLAPIIVMVQEYVADSGGPGYNRGGAATLWDWLVLEPSMVAAFHTNLKRPPAGGGVYNGSPGTAGGAWYWTNIDPAVGLPASTRGPFYRAATPLLGVLDPETKELDRNGLYHFTTGEVPVPGNSYQRKLGNGGGGWGDPLQREPERVLRDVRDEYVSIDGAARDYGVVVLGDPKSDPEGLQVDEEATAALRNDRRGS